MYVFDRHGIWNNYTGYFTKTRPPEYLLYWWYYENRSWRNFNWLRRRIGWKNFIKTIIFKCFISIFYVGNLCIFFLFHHVIHEKIHSDIFLAMTFKWPLKIFKLMWNLSWAIFQIRMTIEVILRVQTNTILFGAVGNSFTISLLLSRICSLLILLS